MGAEMTPSDADQPIAAPVPAERRAEAVELLVQLVGPGEREQAAAAILEAIEQGAVLAEGLLGAWRGDRLAASILVQIQPGKTATVWMPSVAPGEPEATARRLLDAACSRLEAGNVFLAQLLLETVAPAQHNLLTQCGFRHLADLLYLVSLPAEFPQSPPTAPFDLEPCGLENRDRLKEIVEATYRQSQDCPALDGLRRIEDVLAGYEETSESARNLWRIVRHQRRDVGCLLLADYPRHGNCELVYMGVAPAARGRGWGLALTRQAQWLTHQAGRERLVLAVDAVNEPALRIYAAAGFEAWDRRTVYHRVFRPAG